MDCFIIVLGLIIAGVIYFSQSVIGKVMWCEKCNSWEKMTLTSGQIKGWVCPKCNWINQQTLGCCPTCNWYQRYENRTVSHRGPFRKVDRTPVTLFWGIQEEYWVYEDEIDCPKHGVFTAYIPADVYNNSRRNDYEEVDFYDDED